MTGWPEIIDHIGAYGIMMSAADDADPYANEEQYNMNQQLKSAFENEGEIDPEWEDTWAGTHWVLRKVSLAVASVNPHWLVDRDKVRRYAQLPAKNMPPILLGHSWGERPREILDGQHRALAAKRRGAKTILAYIPDDGGSEP